MARGISVHIGLNSVDPAHYDGWDGVLTLCENDARDTMAIATSRGFVARSIVTHNATRHAVLDAIAQAAAQLVAGDIFLISLAGHGGFLPDADGDEADDQDETWCLYDGELIDDELYHAFGAFAAGVRILVVSDSCHSGTIVWFNAFLNQAATDALAPQLLGDLKDADTLASAQAAAPPAGAPRARLMPPEVGVRVYQENRDFYEEQRSQPGVQGARGALAASVILLAGCKDDQKSYDGDHENGAFTEALKSVWHQGAFQGSYHDFVDAIVPVVNNPIQTPQYFVIGAASPAFEAQIPFTI